MGEQRHYRRPPQRRRRPPQPVVPPEPEAQEPRPVDLPKPIKREQQNIRPSVQAAVKPPKRPSKPRAKLRRQTLDSAKKYAQAGLKQAKHSLFQAQLALTRARRRAERRKKEKLAEEESRIGGFAISGRKKRRVPRVTPRQAAALVLACVALWSGGQLIGFAARYVQTRRLEQQLSAAHSETFAVYAQETDGEEPDTTPEPAQTPEPTETPAPQEESGEAALQKETPVPQTVKTTEYQRMGGTPLAQMEKLHTQNTDLVAWLTIDNVLDLPVVYKNNKYYLTHDFNKNKSTAGTVFLDENHPMTERTQNLLLHGHNMKDGTMFGRLAQYEKSIDYFKAHAFIDFSTLWHQEKYVIFAVLNVSLDVNSDRFLDYFAHPTFVSDDEFKNYIRRVELASIYAVPMDVQPSDALLTLSTCLDDDRLVIIARRRREGESSASLREIVNMAVRQ